MCVCVFFYVCVYERVGLPVSFTVAIRGSDNNTREEMYLFIASVAAFCHRAETRLKVCMDLLMRIT